MKQSHRNRLVLAAAGLLAAGAIVAIAPWSGASLPGESNLLTSSNGTGSIMRQGTTALSVTGQTVTEAAWSPDGSRAVFVSADDALYTVRHTGGNTAVRMLPAEPDVQRADPTWLGDGFAFVYSEQSEPGGPWQLEEMLAGFNDLPELITPEDDFNYTDPDAGPGSLVVFQRQAQSGGTGTGTPEIWLRDPDPDPDLDLTLILSDGRNPALSPVEPKVAFVRSDEIFVANLDGSGVTQVTNTPTTKDNPVWSFDGATIAFSNDGGVATVPSSSVNAPSVTTVSGLSGVPAYQTHFTNDVFRLSGRDRFTTAVMVSNFMWDDAGTGSFNADSVVLSRSDLFADALGGAALAAAKNGPLLLTRPTSLNPATADEIVRVLGTSDPASKTVYVLGSESAINASVVQAIRNLTPVDYNIVRLGGPPGTGRYGTAIAIANEISPTPDLVLAATGENFPDALAAGAAAGSFNPFGIPAVVILTKDRVLPAVVVDYLDNLPPTTDVYGVGEQAAVAAADYIVPGSAAFFDGSSRYHTAALVADGFFNGDFFAGVATGENWPDALAGGAAMGVLNGPLLLSKGTTGTLDANTRGRLDRTCGSVDIGLVFGAASVVSAPHLTQIGAAISGPNGFVVGESLAPTLTSANRDAKAMRGTELLRNLDRTRAGGGPAKAIPAR